MYHIQAIQPSIHPVLNVGGRQTCYRRGACPCPCAKRFVSCAALAPSPLRAASAMTGWPNMPGSCPQTRNGSGCMPQCHPVQPASMLEERLEVKHCKHSLIDAMSWCVDRSEGCYLTLVLVARSFPSLPEFEIQEGLKPDRNNAREGRIVGRDVEGARRGLCAACPPLPRGATAARRPDRF
jgi:hypothetical protein